MYLGLLRLFTNDSNHRCWCQWKMDDTPSTRHLCLQSCACLNEDWAYRTSEIPLGGDGQRIGLRPGKAKTVLHILIYIWMLCWFEYILHESALIVLYCIVLYCILCILDREKRSFVFLE